MPLKPSGQRLKDTMGLLLRLERAGAADDPAALGRQLDARLPFGTPIPLPGGGLYRRPGLPLSDGGEGALWLLPGWRVLTVPGDPADGPVERPLADADLDRAFLCGRLRSAVLEDYLGGARLAELSGVTVLAVIQDLLSVTWELDHRGREAVMRLIAAAMHNAAGWDQAAMRLKAGFERGLGDRVPAVRAVCAQALALMACGLGPPLPGTDPGRVLRVLYNVPYSNVRAAALSALAELPDETLRRAAPILAPVVQDALIDADGETRQLASTLQLRLGGAEDARQLSDLLASDDAGLRRQALERLVGEARTTVTATMPLVLDAVDDPDPSVRNMALEVLSPLLDRESGPVRRRVLVTLLAAPDADLARAAIDHLRRDPPTDPEVLVTARAALQGPADNRASVVELVSDLVREAPDDQAIASYAEMLRHEDPTVRWAVLRRLAADPPRQVAVRDELLAALTEHLQDPVPGLRVEAARSVMSLGYPRASEIVMQLAADPEPLVRNGLLAVLRETGAADAHRRAAESVRHVDVLLDLGAAQDGDGRMRWAGALAAVADERMPRAPQLLSVVLAAIPADTTDAFLAFALEELRGGIVELTGGGRDLLRLCHGLLEPREPRPEHAARLAAAVAAEDTMALNFLWTLYSASTGDAAEAARVALAGLAGEERSAAVEAELRRLLRVSQEPAERELLRDVLSPRG